MVFSDYDPQVTFREFPDFLKSEYWRKYEPDRHIYSGKPHMDFSIFTDFIAEKIKNKEIASLRKIFEFLERCVASDDKDLGEAATTCCLENLINFSSSSDVDFYVDPKIFVPLLGPKSKEYCKAWDEFTKVKTPGLW